MQITIAITVLYHQCREWRRRKNKNADDTVQKSIDGTKLIQRKSFINYGSPFSIVEAFLHKNADDTKQIADDTKQIEDDTKQNYGRRHTVYVVPQGSQFCKSGIGILQKGEVIP
ncbi:hypothetical protein T4B_12539 [Trichinella pseudospiralis]|uniref:Uncharacterized protein n=1 Tax=Trichinella pseudospiralis TaxID=6337 RepID=A0A0V1IRA4_TRIPS|nr:hypothetical protein T4B_12539 [Trichinella pseudospiralis]KRZ40177.1 hypothetical protein T4C_14133 [Trichinella pseudospiralis]